MLVLVIPDIVILHLGLLLYNYCKNVVREIKETRPFSDHIDQNVSAIFGVSHTNLRGLPSGISFDVLFSLLIVKVIYKACLTSDHVTTLFTRCVSTNHLCSIPS